MKCRPAFTYYSFTVGWAANSLKSHHKPHLVTTLSYEVFGTFLTNSG